MCEGSGLQATINFDALPILPHVFDYLELGCSPGGAKRNFESYGDHLSKMTARQESIICDPQTSGGLLVAVDSAGESDFLKLTQEAGLSLHAIGALNESGQNNALITVNK
jgi:selenide,water dikinase